MDHSISHAEGSNSRGAWWEGGKNTMAVVYGKRVRVKVRAIVKLSRRSVNDTIFMRRLEKVAATM